MQRTFSNLKLTIGLKGGGIRPIITVLVRLCGMVTSGRGPARNVQARESRTSAGPQYEDAGGLSRIGGYRVGLDALVEEGCDVPESNLVIPGKDWRSS